MSFDKCVTRVRELAGDTSLSDKELRQIAAELDRTGNAQRDLGIGYNDSVIEQAIKTAEELKRASLIEKRNALINIKKRAELQGRIDTAIASGYSPGKAIQAITVGVEGNLKGGRLSVDAQHKASFTRLVGGMVADLESKSLLPMLNSKKINREIAQELWEIGRVDGKPGKTGIPEAKEIAEIIHKYQRVAVERQNRAGADIGKIDGYITRQSHDQSKLRRKGYEAWRDSILPKLDVRRTFGDMDPRRINDFLKSSYDGLASGVHLKAKGAVSAGGDKLLAFKGPSNLGKRISSERVLHFKDADSWYAYNKEFGSADLMESVISGLDTASRNIALMETFGTNPRAMFDKIIDDLRAANRSDPKKFKSIDGVRRRQLDNQFKEVDGTTRIADGVKLAATGSVIRAVQTMAKLGGSVVSSITDIPNIAGEVRFQGEPALKGYQQALTNVMKGRGSTERKQIASMIGVGLDGITGAITARFDSTDNLPGITSKLMQLFFKLNLLQWWTDVHKVGVGMAMSHRVAQLKDVDYADLPDGLQNVFPMYNIDATKWDVVRQAVRKMDDGNEYVLADAVQELPDEVFIKATGKVAPTKNDIQRARDDIETAIQSYYTDRVDYAVLTPGARERAILNQGTQRGTILGEAIRFIMQFKAFPTTMITKRFGRDIYGKGKADIAALVQTTVAMTLMGYLAMAAKDLLKGREPRPLDSPATWAAAFTQGGGAGIYGDFLMGETNRYGKDLISTMAGPTLSSISDVHKIYSALKSGDDAASKTLNTIINNFPGANLFYVRPALDYMFIYELQEFLNPGYLRRMERRVRKENNQEFYLKPSSFVR